MKKTKTIAFVLCAALFISSCALTEAEPSAEEPVDVETEYAVPDESEPETDVPASEAPVPEGGLPEKDNFRTVYKSENVEVVAFDNVGPVIYVNTEWAAPPSYEKAFTENTVIFTGTVDGVREATVTYEYMGSTRSSEITIFDFAVVEIFSSRSASVNAGDTVTVGVGYNTCRYAEGLPFIKKGESYLIFCYPPAERENSIEAENYLDFWIYDCRHLFLEKTGGSYLSVGYFGDIPGASLIYECMSLTEQKIRNLSMFSDSGNAANHYIDTAIAPDADPDNPDAADALKLLRSRTAQNSSELLILLSDSYVIKSGDLEEFVREKAAEYGS